MARTPKRKVPPLGRLKPKVPTAYERTVTAAGEQGDLNAQDAVILEWAALLLERDCAERKLAWPPCPECLSWATRCLRTRARGLIEKPLNAKG